MSLDGKVVLITGATGGLGRTLTRAFADDGAHLALAARTFRDLYEMENGLLERSRKAVAFPCDVRYEDEVIRLVHRVVSRHGRIDCLINAAASSGPRQSLVDYPLDPWREAIATNLTGAYLMCREVLPWMQRAGAGSIINVTSGVTSGKTGWGALVASQCGVEGLTRMLAAETRDSGVRVNMVDVGMPKSDKRAAECPPEIAAPFLWLAGDASLKTSGRRIIAAEFSTPAAESIQ